MASVNRVFLMGNLTRDPEIRYTQSGTAMTKVGLAVNRRVRDSGTDQWRDEVDFIDVVVFGRRAEVISEYFRKGNPIFIEGRLSYRSWETESGERRSKLEVVMDNFEFIGGRGQGAGSDDSSSHSETGEPSGQGSQSSSKPEVAKEDMPSYGDSGFKDEDVPF